MTIEIIHPCKNFIESIEVKRVKPLTLYEWPKQTMAGFNVDELQALIRRKPMYLILLNDQINQIKIEAIIFYSAYQDIYYYEPGPKMDFIKNEVFKELLINLNNDIGVALKNIPRLERFEIIPSDG